MTFLKKTFTLLALMQLTALPNALNARAEDTFQNTVPITIKGKTFTVLQTLEAPGFIILNPMAAKEINHKDKSWFSPKVKIVGHTLKGKSQALPATINGISVKKSKIFSFGRDYIRGYDGAVGPGALPYNEIIFHFAKGAPQEPTHNNSTE